MGADADVTRRKKGQNHDDIPHLPASGGTPIPAQDLFQVPSAHSKTTRGQVRRYTVSSLLPNGAVAETRHLAPALPIFEDAFCAFSRGTVLDTVTGPMAIEDMLPGDQVITLDGASQPIVWKGSVTIAPGLSEVNRRPMSLTRIMADSFGMSRPMACVIAGPSARYFAHAPPSARSGWRGADADASSGLC